MLKVFATQVVVSRGYDGAAAIKFSEKGDAVRFRIGKKVYDPNAENNARWINLAVKGFGPICERIKKMQLKDGSFVNLIGRLDEDVWEDQQTHEKKSAMVIILDDMDYDPTGVYMALTGVENAAATSQDCMSIVLDRVTEKVRELSKTAEDKSSSGQTYRYVETDFIKALKHGYVIEIQEPSTIVQPGVLVGLNSLLEQSGSITLPTGEVIQRHPDAVVVVTTNTSYEGCRGMNQSVLDRMSLVRDVELPSPEVMAQRAMSVTGATDEYEVSKMVQVVNDLAEYCRKNSITDGSYGMRSLIDWIISSEITGDVYESALYTIISKATADELDREALISTVLEPIFAPKRHKASA